MSLNLNHISFKVKYTTSGVRMTYATRGHDIIYTYFGNSSENYLLVVDHILKKI